MAGTLDGPQVGAELLCYDFFPGRPRRPFKDLGAPPLPGDDVGGQVERFAAGDQRRPKDRMQRLGGRTGLCQVGYGVCCGVRLLGAHSTVFDGKVSGVTGSEDVTVCVSHSRVLINTDEAVDRIAGDALHVRPGQLVERHGALWMELAAGSPEHKSMVTGHLSGCRAVDVDPGSAKECADGVAGVPSEDVKRPGT